MNIGVILAAGDSKRFNSEIHKQYLKLNGKEVIYYSLEAFKQAKKIDKILLVVDSNEYKSKYIENKYNIECIEGGLTRNQSIRNALDYIKKNYPDTINVIFHDSTRPYINSEVFDSIIDLLKDYDGVAITARITDSLGDDKLNYVSRNNFKLIQTPEGFNFKKLEKIFSSDSSYTAIVHQMSEHKDMKIYKYEKKDFSFRITYPEDLFLGEQLMRVNYIKNEEMQNINASAIKGKVLLLGGSGGMGKCLQDEFKKYNVDYYAPSFEELDLSKSSFEDFKKVCLPYSPDIIINVAAVSSSDQDGLIESFELVMNVNLRTNLYIIELAKLLNKRVNIVLLSSSSSTRGRENITNYSASKAALNSVVESQSECLRNKNIYLNAIIPEKVNTPMIAKLHKTKISDRELLPVERVVEVILEYAQTDEYGKLIHIRKGL